MITLALIILFLPLIVLLSVLARYKAFWKFLGIVVLSQLIIWGSFIGFIILCFLG